MSRTAVSQSQPILFSCYLKIVTEKFGVKRKNLFCDDFWSQEKKVGCDWLTNLWTDATTAIAFAKNTVSGSRMGHVYDKQAWVELLRNAHMIAVCKMDTKVNPADIFTKYFPDVRAFKQLISQFMHAVTIWEARSQQQLPLRHSQQMHSNQPWRKDTP